MEIMEGQPNNSCGLLDLPQDLLRACLPELDGMALQWAACRSLLNLQLEGDGTRSLGLCLHIWQAEDEAAKRETLVRMANSFPALRKLHVRINEELMSKVLASLLTPPPTRGPAWLINIVDMTLSAEWQVCEGDAPCVESFIPHCAAMACPQLQRLELRHITCKQQQQQHWQPITMPCLQELVLDSCSIDMQPAAVQQQLQALPSLQHLKVTGRPNRHVVQALSDKITALKWGPYRFIRVAEPQVAYPQLHKLTVLWMTSAADWTHMLKYMPNLQHLQVLRQIRMMDTFAGDLSQIKTMTLMCWLDWDLMTSLRHLLLCTAQPPQLCFCGGTGSLRIEVTEDSTAEKQLQVVSEFMAIVQRAGGIRRCDGSMVELQPVLHSEVEMMSSAVHSEIGVGIALHSGIGVERALHSGTGLCSRNVQCERAQVLQVLQHLFFAVNDPQRVWLWVEPHIDRTLLAAVGSVRSCKHLDLAGICTIEDGIWADMCCLLPHVTELSLWFQHPIALSDLKTLSSNATYAITVHLFFDTWARAYDTEDEAHEHMQEALHALEGTLVKLQVKFRPYS